jgi:hypothetical protein
MNARHDAFAERVRYLDSLGPRLTGSGAHRALVENVAEQLTGLGLTVHRDPHHFTRWNAPRDSTHLNLTVGDRPITISSAYPYSGTTVRAVLNATPPDQPGCSCNPGTPGRSRPEPLT